jgi:hypothetical protein
MNIQLEKMATRREFLKGVLRNVFLGVLFLIGWTFGKRTLSGAGASKSGEQGLRAGNLPCGACTQRPGCAFVQARTEPECPNVNGRDSGNR